MELGSYNKRFKRDSQRVAFVLCVEYCGYTILLNHIVALSAP
ncbi:DUF3265 domain-containing protein [Vibrio cholerae]|nr:DUF3265 domain-containing protein [Vibrio cholerae]